MDSSQGGSSESSGGRGERFNVFSELCISQAEQAGCEGVETFEGETVPEPWLAWCVWEVSIPVEVVENGDCVFGEPTGRCLVATSSTDGCGSSRTNCDGVGGGPFGAVRETDSGRALVEGSFCYGVPDASPCVIGEGGVVLEDAPRECGCFCAPGFPE